MPYRDPGEPPIDTRTEFQRRSDDWDRACELGARRARLRAAAVWRLSRIRVALKRKRARARRKFLHAPSTWGIALVVLSFLGAVGVNVWKHAHPEPEPPCQDRRALPGETCDHRAMLVQGEGQGEGGDWVCLCKFTSATHLTDYGDVFPKDPPR